MATTRRVMQTLAAANVDFELVSSLLSANSDAEATVALTLLRDGLTDRELIEIANLRELLNELPVKPFRTGESLEMLQRAGGYEFTGRSYRRLFDSSQGVFGIEFLGEVRDCEGIVVHTPQGRRRLCSAGGTRVDESLLPLLVDHGILLDAILEALELLGSPLDPAIYMTVNDFLAEHGAGTMRDAIGSLF
ncbi:MAG: hypothetical protein P4L93_03030 [Coriobacteriia bacterium]|nr:hypothetical protein [Coriobacteriia bacterium]